MMGQPSNEDARNQVQFICLDELVPQDHLLRKIDETISTLFMTLCARCMRTTLVVRVLIRSYY